MNKEQSAVNRFRTNIGVDILLAMDKNEDLPLPNKYRLAKTMQEYYVSLGYSEIVEEQGYKWEPNEDYWMYKMDDIRDTLRKKHKMFFIFKRTIGGRNFEGLWKFGTKAEYEESLRLEHKEIHTRVNTHNVKLTDGQQRWKIDLPLIDKIQLLN